MANSRNDRRTQARDVFGKPGVSYDEAATDFPKVVENRTARQGEALKDYLVPHKRLTQALLTQQKSTPGDNTDAIVTEVYESLPGPEITTVTYSEKGEVETHVTQRVVGGTAPDADGLLVKESTVAGDTVVTALRRKTTVAANATITTKTYHHPRLDVKGALATITEQIVAPTTAPPAPGTTLNGGLVIHSDVNGISLTKSAQTISTITSWPIIYDWLWEEEVQAWALVKYEVVAKVIDTPAPTAPTAGVEIDYKGIDDAWTTKITKTLQFSSLTALSYTENSQINYDFPAILNGAVTAISLAKKDKSDVFKVFGNVTASRRVVTNAKLSVSFHASYAAAAAAAPTITQIKPLDFAYSGALYSINLGSLLCDGQTVSGTTGTENPDWGYIVDSVTFGSSTPSASTYLSWLLAPSANTIKLPVKITQWRYNLYKMEAMQVEPR